MPRNVDSIKRGLGQGLGLADSPTFVGLTLSGLTASLPVVTDGSTNLVSLAYTGATSLRKNLGLETSDSPTWNAGTGISGSNPGTVDLNVRSTKTDGTGEGAQLSLFTSNTLQVASIVGFDQDYASFGPYLADALLVRALRAGGLNLVGEHASGPIRFYTGGTTLRATIPSTGGFSVVGEFGCNGANPQAAYATTAWDEPGAGLFGVDSAAHMATLVTLVKNMQAALIANGILS